MGSESYNCPRYVRASLSAAITCKAVLRAALSATLSGMSSASGGVIGSGGMGSQTRGIEVARPGETGVRGWYLILGETEGQDMIGRSSIVEAVLYSVDRDGMRTARVSLLG